MKKLLLILTLFSLGACQNSEVINYSTDSELEVFKQKFYSFMDEKGIDYNRSLSVGIKFAELKEGVFGQCVINKKNKSRGIRINSNTWDDLPLERKEALIFHELGHCVLGRGHENTGFWNGFYGYTQELSLMSTHLLETHFYTENYGYYLYELFNFNADLWKAYPINFDYEYYGVPAIENPKFAARDRYYGLSKASSSIHEDNHEGDLTDCVFYE